jgi:Zn-dependent protease with chaperone function
MLLSASAMVAAVRVQNAPRRPALLFWGILTVLVLVSAYLLALAIAAGCVIVCIGGISTFSAGGVILGIGAGVCAGTILWSIFPRRDAFAPPGVLLDADSQPRLFQEITAIAAEFNEPMPAEAYLFLEPNAWVAQRGGFLGFGSFRVLALGLPLLSRLTVSEFRAVLAHEFAHYYGGDTGFGPFVAKAQNALLKSLERLSQNSGILGFLSRWAIVALLRLLVVGLLSLYWKLFIRLMLVVSRRWEYRADELACAVAGGTHLISGLEKLPRIEAAWVAFLESEYWPAMQAGVRPPLAQGFARYCEVPEIAEKMSAAVAERLKAEKPDPLSSHPTFSQRAARALPDATGVTIDDRPAIMLLDSVAELEAVSIQVVIPEAKVNSFQKLDWEDLGEQVYLPARYTFAAEYRELLSEYTIGSIPEAVLRLSVFAAKLRDPKGMLLTREQRVERCVTLLSNAFALALYDAGWRLCTEPGRFCLTHDGQRLVPAALVARLRAATLSPTEFHGIVNGAGIAGLSLAPPERSFPAPPAVLEAPVSPQHLILRPRLRVLGWQALIALGVFAFLGLWVALTVHHILGLVVGIAAALSFIIGELIWFRRSAPRAIVATPDGLAITWHDGKKQRFSWSDIVLAEHKTPRFGTLWEFTLKSEGTVVLHDTGIDPGRWATLRAIILHFADARSFGVAEDGTTSQIYEEAGEEVQ